MLPLHVSRIPWPQSYLKSWIRTWQFPSVIFYLNTHRKLKVPFYAKPCVVVAVIRVRSISVIMASQAIRSPVNAFQLRRVLGYSIHFVLLWWISATNVIGFRRPIMFIKFYDASTEIFVNRSVLLRNCDFYGSTERPNYFQFCLKFTNNKRL